MCAACISASRPTCGVLWSAVHKRTDMLPCMSSEAGFALVFEDEAMVVVDKAAGLLSVPGRGEGVALNLTTYVQARWPDALVVHRLDQATSGLIVFARGADAQRALSVAFAERRVYKRYEAVVRGVVATDENGRVQRFVEKPAPGTAPSNLINAGTYVFEPSMFIRQRCGTPVR